VKQTHDILGKVPCKMPGGCQALVLNGLISVDSFQYKEKQIHYLTDFVFKDFNWKISEN